MEEKTIQKIPVWPFALMIAAICGVIGLLMGIFCGLIFAAAFSTMMANISTGTTFAHPLVRLLFGIGAVILMPIMAFIGGLIHGAIIAYIYNFLAPRIGGIKIRFKEGNPTFPP
jgi:ABC-type nitrate/sulfonate/bicarbonate transport system permease component